MVTDLGADALVGTDGHEVTEVGELEALLPFGGVVPAVTPAGVTMAAPCMNPANMTYMPASRARSYRDASPASSPK
ncbi:hypothetical protein QQY66_39765 [Streptomyces sp. DG2A-72]|nr:hypothetical protein [Streptomyces sp. DG2A-72]MDO0937567.1 hypothetical protein [Streptomyces sp. DG2A-72]